MPVWLGLVVIIVIAVILLYIVAGCLIAYDFWLKVTFRAEDYPQFVAAQMEAKDYIAMIFLWGIAIITKDKNPTKYTF